ncbi:diguanylate cyclase domain-containing protein [Leptothrix sp. BB-4]
MSRAFPVARDALDALDAFYRHFGAHRVDGRGRHEIDRVIQRIVITVAVGLVTFWQEPGTDRLAPIVPLMPWAALVYVLLSLAYWRVIRRRPDAAVGAQYAFLVVDPLVTVLALMAAPTMLAPLNMFLMVQIVRCGIRYGVRTLWLTWAVSLLASAALMPLSNFWTMAQPLTLSHIAMLVITPLLFAPLIASLHRATDDLRQAATSDPLTGLANRRMLGTHLQGARQRSRREQTALALILFDLDRFKTVNDAYGHAKGDELLLRVTAALKGRLRGSDFLARIGGDEFVLLLEGLDETHARLQAGLMAQKIVGLVEAVSRECCPDLPVSASVGVHTWSADDPDGGDENVLIDHADRAMYAAKRAGKGRAVHSSLSPLD